ncbi:MAG: TssN family type VI secretion system protein [Ferruginibacter sp.]
MEIRSAEYKKDNEMMMAMHPSWRIAHPVKRTIIYSLVFVLIGLVLSLLFTSGINWGFTGPVKKILFVTLFLLIGIGHIFSFSKWLPHLHNQDSKTGIIYSLLLALLLSLATFLSFVFNRFENTQLALAVAGAFLLPVAIQHAWHYFDFIAVPETYQPWFIPNEIPSEEMVAPFLDNLPVEIKLKMNYYDIAETSFKVTIPDRLTLGKMFHEFLMDKEAKSIKIQLADQEQQPYAWRFLLQRPFSMTNVDPNLTLADNRIKPKDIILAERIKISLPSPGYHPPNYT